MMVYQQLLHTLLSGISFINTPFVFSFQTKHVPQDTNVKIKDVLSDKETTIHRTKKNTFYPICGLQQCRNGRIYACLTNQLKLS